MAIGEITLTVNTDGLRELEAALTRAVGVMARSQSVGPRLTPGLGVAAVAAGAARVRLTRRQLLGMAWKGGSPCE